MAISKGQLLSISDVVFDRLAAGLCYLCVFYLADCISSAPCSYDVLLHDR